MAHRSPFPLLAIPLLTSCLWPSALGGRGERIYNLDQVQEPPRLLSCGLYRPPLPNDTPVRAMKLEFIVTRHGVVTEVRGAREGPLLSSTAVLGEAMAMAQSCSFRPARLFNRPVGVRTSMWFFW